jgi:predicted O-methyltransferase YrrM
VGRTKGMNITKRLMELDPTLELHNEGDWENKLDPNKPGYTSFNDAGVETETGEFLYAMVRLLKPKRVLETGTHLGVGASYMGTALKDNKSGILTTIEFLPEIWTRSKSRMLDLKLDGFVENLFMDVKEFDPKDERYQLILLDTEPQTRFAELIKFYPYLDPGGFVFIHDLHRHMGQHDNEEHGFAWPYGPIPKELADLVRAGLLRPIHFSTPRGLTGFYKVHPEDFKWV